MSTGLLVRLRAVRTLPPRLVLATALASLAGFSLGALQGQPLWAILLLGVLPWVPVLAFEMVWTYRHYGWLALFYVLVITQSAHFLEHVAQMYQIHVLHLHGSHAQGVFGRLNIEWVHFLWNTWVFVAAALLAYRFRRNWWLLPTLAIALWHESEHLYIMVEYWTTGAEGTPGLLAQGGAIAGGTSLTRPDLHFLYNAVETLPLVVAFAYQLRRSYDVWLARAFPLLSEDELTRITPRLRSLRFRPGRTIVSETQSPNGSYVLVKGQVDVVRRVGDGDDVHVATLGPGRLLGAPGSVPDVPTAASAVATTPVEVLVVDRETARTALGPPPSSDNGELPEALVVLRQRLRTAKSEPAGH